MATTSTRSDAALVDRLRAVVTGAVDAGEIPGAAWYVRRGDLVVVGAAGTHGPGYPGAIDPDTVFRLSSLTKPVVAAAAMSLVDDRVLDLDAPVDDVLPELAHRRVLVDALDPSGPTVPASRPITARDLLEFRLGLGTDFSGPWPFGEVMAAAGVEPAPPAPAATPAPEEWMRRIGSLPLAYQPGERWLYHTSASVLGVLLARVAGCPLPDLLTTRVLKPLGMRSTGFGVPGAARPRLGPHWAWADPSPSGDAPSGDASPTGASGGDVPAPPTALRLYDPPDGQWARPPAFPDAGDGLVSTVGDLAAFAEMLRSGGVASPEIVGRRDSREAASPGSVGRRVLREDAVRAMTTERVGPVDDEGGGWGLGIGVRRTDEPVGRHAGSYGWEGGMGSTWWTDPVSDVTAILLTNVMWGPSGPSAVFARFRGAAFGGR